MSNELPESLEPDDEGQMAPRNEMVAAPAEEQAAKQVEDVIEQTAPEILKPLRQEIAKRVISITQQQFSGPLPPPWLLADYERIIPGSALRIFNRAEKQSDHRIAMEARVIPAQQKQSERGQHYGLIVAMTGLILSGIMVLTGHDWAGGIIGGTTLVSMVTVFVQGRQSQVKDLKDKRGE